MKNISKYLAWALVLMPVTLNGRTLTPEQALSRVSDTPAARALAQPGQRPALLSTVMCDDGEAALYTFGSRDGGYMIVSADDNVRPLLGYSDNGTFDAESMPPQLRWWLDEYARQIEYTRNNTSGAVVTQPFTTQQRKAIAPLLKTSWDQGAPYYDQCPVYDGEHTWTGCVATAMAQVMNYYQYPAKGTGSISYNAESIGKRLSLNFALKKFDWDNMLPTYAEDRYNDTQSAAVAYLMKACGYSVKMDYGLDASGALAMNIRRALIKYFGYDASMRHELRQLYTASQWGDIIYQSVADGCPVLYGGASMIGGGHSFVCDGYDGDGYFHFNWGWTGMSDGYFLLDALNPYSLGAGGGGGGGYNFSQDAVVGVKPSTGEPVAEAPATLVQTGSLACYEKNDSICFALFAENGPMWVNYTPEDFKGALGVLVEKDNDPSFQPYGIMITPGEFRLQPGYGVGPEAFVPGFLKEELGDENGSYKLTVATKPEDSDVWTPVQINHGYFNYVHLTKQGSTYTIDNNDVWRLEVKDVEVDKELYYGMGMKLKITVENGSDYQMTRGFAPVILYNGGVVMLGESIYLTVDPESTATQEWSTNMYVLQQYFNVTEDLNVYLTLFDESTYNMWSEDVMVKMTLHPSPGLAKVSTNRAPAIVGAASSTEYVPGSLDKVKLVKDKNNIEVKGYVNLQEGRFGYEMYAVIVNGSDMAIQNYGGHMVLLDEPQSHVFNTKLNCPTLEGDKLYRVLMGYSYGGNMVQIGPHETYFRLDTAGVESVVADSSSLTYADGIVTADGDIEVFNLNGVKVAEGHGILDVNNLTHGIYVVRSSTETIKITKI